MAVVKEYNFERIKIQCFDGFLNLKILKKIKKFYWNFKLLLFSVYFYHSFIKKMNLRDQFQTSWKNLDDLDFLS